MDLRHRLPALWAVTFTDAAFEVWVLRRIAVLTRGLDPEAAELIGLELAGVVGSLPAPRLLEKVESMVLLAEAQAVEEDRQDNLGKRFVAFNKSNQRGLKGLYAKLSAADAVIGEAQVQRLAELLLAQDLAAGVDRVDLDSMAVARSRALGLLIANPDSALALIAAAHAAAVDEDAGPADDEPAPADDNEPADDQPQPVDRPADQSSAPASQSGGSRWAPVTTVLHLHLSEDALQALAHAKAHGDHPAGVGRLEGHGPLSLPEALELLQLSQVVIRPVLDPWATAPVDSYAFTGNLREAVLARVPADCYPYGVNTTHAMDIDHTRAYDPAPTTQVVRRGRPVSRTPAR
ncbi:hypothetical protein [Nocardioides sp. Root151]|uniref:hypothetical protein n=1 Tax=Nocardioides sp. Root151 TaxID=1736475 RepID=UPI0012E39CC3|nr:hypothetical protein [Nocardioides sp. Root151]